MVSRGLRAALLLGAVLVASYGEAASADPPQPAKSDPPRPFPCCSLPAVEPGQKAQLGALGVEISPADLWL